MKYVNFFKGKKITLIGFGLLGRGVGDAKFLAKYAGELIITDLKNEEKLKDNIEQLSSFKNVKFTLGKHELQDFQNRDMVIKSAGVPINSLFVNEALKNQIPVYMSTALFAKFFKEDFNGTLVGITGTRGKTTVTHLVHSILKKAGKSVLIGGNERGVSTLAFLDTAEKNSIAVLELDSWQLQGFGTLGMSPDVSVFTTFFPDHMNYYLDMQEYFDDKANIFKFQRSGDTLITTNQAFEQIQKYYDGNMDSVCIVVNPLPTNNPELIGVHNEVNAACALEVARALNITDEISLDTIKEFKAVEGRLQYVKTVNGVKIYNDNNSTTPDATIAGLKALGSGSPKRNIVLIMGGDDKKLDMSGLIKEIPKHCKSVVLFNERGTDRIKEDVKNIPGINVFEEEGLESCVRRAVEESMEGDIILYSPAFFSFGKYFKNEYDRGEQFNLLIKKL